MDFSLTTVVVAPPGAIPSPVSKSTQDLVAGEVGIFGKDYVAVDAGTAPSQPYLYIAQGRDNTYLQGTKRSDKIAASQITEWYKVAGCPTPLNQITEISDWSVQCGEKVTVTLRGHSSYLDTLYFNGFTRSVTVNAPCCDCDGGDPCEDVDAVALVDDIIAKFEMMGTDEPNPDNISVTQFYTFTNNSGTLVIEGKPVTKYGEPCDVAAFPHEYDRMWFRAFAIEGPETTADFIVDDACDVIATIATTQESTYPTGTSEEIEQLEKNFHSYQAGYLKHLYRTAGYNQNYEGHVVAGTTYTTYYIKFNDVDKSAEKWGDYVSMDSTVILAVPSDDAAPFEAILTAAFGAPEEDSVYDVDGCPTTTTTTST